MTGNISSNGYIKYNPKTFYGDSATYNETISYTYTDTNGCQNNIVDNSISVKHQPILKLIIPQFQDSVCLEDPAFSLDIQYFDLGANTFNSYPTLQGRTPLPGFQNNYFEFQGNQPSDVDGWNSKKFIPKTDSKNDQDGVVTQIKFIGTYAQNGECYDTLISQIVTNPKPDAHFYLNGYCGKYKPVMHGDSSFIDTTGGFGSDGLSRYEWTIDGNDSAYTAYNDTLVDFEWYHPIGLNKINIDVVAVSKKGCRSDVFTKQIQFLTSPDADFYWLMGDECEGSNVRFIADRGGVADYPTTTFFWNFGDTDTSTARDTALHQFQAVDTFSVMLVLTEGGSSCQDTMIKNIFVRPIVDPSDPGYTMNDFEAAYNGWVPWMEVGDPDSIGFVWGTPNKQYISSAYSGSRAFVTGISKNYSLNIQSSVIGPCFDLSNMERPMVKMQTLYKMNENDGVVLQYTLDTDSTLENARWFNVGRYVNENNQFKATGINWYLKDNIFGNPGGQSNIQGRIGWTGLSDSSWAQARYDIDNLIGKPYVRFRVALGSDPAVVDEGFAFDDFEITERKRKVLFEGFVNGNTTGTDKLVIDDYNEVVQDSSFLDVVDIQYHTSFPANDAMNKQNTPDPSTRSLYYSVGEVPFVHVNGTDFKGLMNSKDFGWTVPKALALTDPIFKIDMAYNKSNKQVTVNLTATGPASSYPVDVNLQIATIEPYIKASEFTSDVYSGYTGFYNVLKKMYPSAGGTNLTAGFPGWTNSTSQTVSFENFFDTTFRIVAFVQDRNTKKVYQAEWVGSGKIGTDVKEYSDVVADGIDYNLYPNPTNGTTYMEFRDELLNSYDLRVFNQLGTQVLFEIVPKGTRLHVLNMNRLDAGMYFIMLNDGVHEVAIKKLMVTH